MKNVLVMMLAASFAFASQAGEVRWEAGDATEGGYADVMSALPQDAVDSIASFIRLDSVNNMIGRLYNSVFTLSASSHLSEELEDVRDKDERLAAAPHSGAYDFDPFADSEDEDDEGNCVPEPSATLLVLAGAAAMLLRRKRR